MIETGQKEIQLEHWVYSSTQFVNCDERLNENNFDNTWSDPPDSIKINNVKIQKFEKSTNVMRILKQFNPKSFFKTMETCVIDCTINFIFFEIDCVKKRNCEKILRRWERVNASRRVNFTAGTFQLFCLWQISKFGTVHTL